MKSSLLAAGAAVLLLPVPAMAQGMEHDMHGMTMPMKPAEKAKAKPTPALKKRRAAPAPRPSPPKAGTRSGDEGNQALPVITPDVATGPRPSPGKQEGETAPTPTPTPAPMPMDHSRMDHGTMSHDMSTMPGLPMQMGRGGSDYAEGSGTSRLPANEGMMQGAHLMTGDWMLMAHGYAWGAYTDQGGPRGENMAFVQSMAMLTAERPLGDGVNLRLQTMLSLEPLMGARGYPSLLATGEAANEQPLIDRQHPHDLFMELSGKLDVDVGCNSRVFLYGGPVGEPALGPSAFMHRKSAQYNPMAPITHHWFDSTHITYGVVTIGYATPKVQIEASAFRGREPDERRWGIETPKLDSWSVRGTWTPSPAWAVQVSYGHLKSPEELEPEGNERRTTASVQYATGALTTTFAFSAKDKGPDRTLTAFLGEVNWDLDAHNSLFGRFENVANDELFPDEASPLHHRRFRVGKLEGGYARRVKLVGPVNVALGGTVGTYFLPAALDGAYSKMPVSFTLFAKVSLGS